MRAELRTRLHRSAALRADGGNQGATALLAKARVGRVRRPTNGARYACHDRRRRRYPRRHSATRRTIAIAAVTPAVTPAMTTAMAAQNPV